MLKSSINSRVLQHAASLGLVALIAVLVFSAGARKKDIVSLSSDDELNLCVRSLPGSQSGTPVFVSCAGFF